MGELEMEVEYQFDPDIVKPGSSCTWVFDDECSVAFHSDFSGVGDDSKGISEEEIGKYGMTIVSRMIIVIVNMHRKLGSRTIVTNSPEYDVLFNRLSQKCLFLKNYLYVDVDDINIIEYGKLMDEIQCAINTIVKISDVGDFPNKERDLYLMTMYLLRISVRYFNQYGKKIPSDYRARHEEMEEREYSEEEIDEVFEGVSVDDLQVGNFYSLFDDVNFSCDEETVEKTMDMVRSMLNKVVYAIKYGCEIPEYSILELSGVIESVQGLVREGKMVKMCIEEIERSKFTLFMVSKIQIVGRRIVDKIHRLSFHRLILISYEELIRIENEIIEIVVKLGEIESGAKEKIWRECEMSDDVEDVCEYESSDEYYSSLGYEEVLDERDGRAFSPVSGDVGKGIEMVKEMVCMGGVVVRYFSRCSDEEVCESVRKMKGIVGEMKKMRNEGQKVLSLRVLYKMKFLSEKMKSAIREVDYEKRMKLGSFTEGLIIDRICERIDEWHQWCLEQFFKWKDYVFEDERDVSCPVGSSEISCVVERECAIERVVVGERMWIVGCLCVMSILVCVWCALVEYKIRKKGK